MCRPWIKLVSCGVLLCSAFGWAQEALLRDIEQLQQRCALQQQSVDAHFRKQFLDKMLTWSSAAPSYAALLADLKTYYLVGQTGEDRSLRPMFSLLQEDLERTLVAQLSSGSVKKAIVIIHAGSIPDPLSVSPAALPSSDLMALGRPNLLRTLLEHGVSVYALYPSTGGSKRTPAELLCYKNTLAQYPGALVDAPIADTFLARNQHGTSYLMLSARGEWWLFSIGGAQKLDALERDRWQVWFAPLCSAEGMSRLGTVSELLTKAVAHKNSARID